MHCQKQTFDEEALLISYGAAKILIYGDFIQARNMVMGIAYFWCRSAQILGGLRAFPNEIPPTGLDEILFDSL
jgi:hypothetical protein